MEESWARQGCEIMNIKPLNTWTSQDIATHTMQRGSSWGYYGEKSEQPVEDDEPEYWGFAIIGLCLLLGSMFAAALILTDPVGLAVMPVCPTDAC